MPARKPYEAPRLRQLAVGPMGKHRLVDVLPAGEVEGGWDVADLIARFGSPLFIVSEERLRALYGKFLETFTGDGVTTRIAYSYKTNYLPALCAVMAGEGAWAEVVSGMEYSLARALGVPAPEIVFNGPYKTREELERAIGEGALVNIDGFDELAAVEAVARSVGRTARIGLRINFRADNQVNWTKFGFSVEHGEAEEALGLIVGKRRLWLEALHNHCGTYNVDPGIYTRAVRALLQVARSARRLGLAPTVIDLGGGFPSANVLKPAFAAPGMARRPGELLDEFADAVLKPLARARGLFGPTPTLILEPGRAVVDSAMQLACTVVATKEIAGQGAAVVVDAGVNVLPTAYWYNHHVDAVDSADSDTADGMRQVTVYGPLCMQIDVLREQALLPPLAVGTPLVIHNVGAYCLTQSMQFIQPRPAVVMIGPDGPVVVRRREEWRDIFALDSVPARLRREGHAL
ncbi:MAG: diaminopimelate decarboxylase [Proteobacteria bacterium]|nr:diaminopimelate decarboxylase [Pseudomonadota bacterium]